MLIQRLLLPLGSQGVICIRSYTQGERVAEEMDCLFYKANTVDKQELVEQWAGGCGSSRGWMVATGVLGTGINISGIVYIVHLGQLYRLTSFMQQAGQGEQAGEISNSIVILSSSSSNSNSSSSNCSNNGGSGSSSGNSNSQFLILQAELVNIYLVEAQDEAALTEYLESSSCRRAILAKHLDSDVGATSCLATDSILCNRCKEELLQLQESSGSSGSGSGGGSSSSGSSHRPESGCSSRPVPSGIEAIHQALQVYLVQDKQLSCFHQLLHMHCIYCQLMRAGEGDQTSHCHHDCQHAAAKHCGIEAYQQWQSRLRLAPCQQCFWYRLSQSLCRAVEEQTQYIYPYLILPGLFFLHQVGHLLPICCEIGFGGGKEEKAEI